MKIGIIADIHGNYVALAAALADLDRAAPDRVVCLGDAIQGGPQPGEVVRALRERGWPVVMGNADAWLLTGVETADEGAAPERKVKMDAVRAWSLAHLAPDERDYIASFTPTVPLPLADGRNLLAFHGSPDSFDDILLPETPEEEFQRRCGPYADHILCGGHTHLQQVRRLGDTFFFNPGSVGLAYNRAQPETGFHADPWAEYALLTVADGAIGLEFRRVPFDAAELRRVYAASGRPYAEEAAQYA